MAKTAAKQIKIRLKGSLIGASPAQRKVVQSLGLIKTSQIVEHYETPIIMGMVKKVPHLVKLV